MGCFWSPFWGLGSTGEVSPPLCHSCSTSLSLITVTHIWAVCEGAEAKLRASQAHLEIHFLGSLQFPSLQYRWVMSRTSLCAGAFWNITGSIDPSSLSHRPIFSPPSTNWVPEMRLSQVAVTSHCCLV